MGKHYIEFYTGDYLRDTRGLSLAEHGAYLMLLNHIWSTGDLIPLCPKEYYRIAGAHSKAEKRAVDRILGSFFEPKTNGFENKKAIEVFQKRERKIEQLRRNGSRGGRPQKANENQKVSKSLSKTEPEGGDNQNHNQNHNTRINISDPDILGRRASAPPPQTSGKSSSTQGRRLSEDWKPSVELVEWANAERKDIDIDTEIESFRDYWLAKPGKEGRKTDWGRTFKNWIRRARPAMNTGGRSPDSERLRGLAIPRSEERTGGFKTL